MRGDGRRRRRRAGTRAGGAVSAACPDVERDYPLARLTTVRTGGSGEYFARAGSESQLLELLAWADAEGLAVSVVGSGSNLLIADEGVPGLVVKLDRELAAISIAQRRRILCGGGARLPAVAARAARAGLSGIEFGVNIPGTVGGAVRMNANAYGGELERCSSGCRSPPRRDCSAASRRSSGFGYRHSNLSDGEIVARAGLVLTPADVAAVKATLAADAAHAATRPSRRGSRRSARRSRTPTRSLARRGSQRGPAARGGRLQRAGGRRRALRAQARQLHREHRRGHDRGRDRGDGRGPPPRARALRRGAGAGGADARRRALSLV